MSKRFRFDAGLDVICPSDGVSERSPWPLCVRLIISNGLPVLPKHSGLSERADVDFKAGLTGLNAAALEDCTRVVVALP